MAGVQWRAGTQGGAGAREDQLAARLELLQKLSDAKHSLQLVPPLLLDLFWAKCTCRDGAAVMHSAEAG
jgi:hypothetical protein